LPSMSTSISCRVHRGSLGARPAGVAAAAAAAPAGSPAMDMAGAWEEGPFVAEVDVTA
jgi:hypothetical protein